jgi:hypothetical protein
MATHDRPKAVRCARRLLSDAEIKALWEAAVVQRMSSTAFRSRRSRQAMPQSSNLKPRVEQSEPGLFCLRRRRVYKRRCRFRGIFLVLIFEFMERIQLFKVGVMTRGTRSVAYLGWLAKTPAPGIGDVPCAGIWSP